MNDQDERCKSTIDCLTGGSSRIGGTPNPECRQLIKKIIADNPDKEHWTSDELHEELVERGYYNNNGD